MDDEKWFRAALTISGPGLELDEVSRLLGLDPAYVRKTGKASGAVLKNAVWTRTSGRPDSAEPAEQLNRLLEQLEPRAAILRELARRFYVEIFCGFSSGNGQGGITFSPALLERLARLGLPFTLDLYPPEGPEER